MDAGFSQKNHGGVFKFALYEGFANQMGYGAAGAKALVSKKVWDSAYGGYFLGGLVDLFSKCWLRCS